MLQACSTSPTKSGCHVAADDHGNALGNLNVTSYDSLSKRQDLFLRYGPYGLPALLLKVAKEYPVSITTWQSAEPIVVSTDIAHGGGQLLDLTSPSFTLLYAWITNGHAVNNAPRSRAHRRADPVLQRSRHRSRVRIHRRPQRGGFFDLQKHRKRRDRAALRGGELPRLARQFAVLTCGSTPEATRWNYFALGDYVSVDTGTSEILRRALSPAAGGVYHEGGTVFSTTDDSGYQALVAWATEKGGPTDQVVPGVDDGCSRSPIACKPLLVKRGCMMINCHSGSMFHDYRFAAAAAAISVCPRAQELRVHARAIGARIAPTSMPAA